MSREALDRARRIKRAKGTIRVIICEEVFEYQIGEMYIAVMHSLSKVSFLLLRQDIDVTNQLAIKKAIHKKAIELAGQIEAARKKIQTNHQSKSCSE
jgi:hypothetical protein